MRFWNVRVAVLHLRTFLWAPPAPSQGDVAAVRFPVFPFSRLAAPCHSAKRLEARLGWARSDIDTGVVDDLNGMGHRRRRRSIAPARRAPQAKCYPDGYPGAPSSRAGERSSAIAWPGLRQAPLQYGRLCDPTAMLAALHSREHQLPGTSRGGLVPEPARGNHELVGAALRRLRSITAGALQQSH
jgi:hypothetical protein